MNVPKHLLPLFWAKVDKTTDPAGCWLWTGAKYWDGYGLYTYRRTDTGQRTTGRAHRLAYEILVGNIPEGMVIDHLCRVRNCVNPSHMEIVTKRENTLRGETIIAAYAKRTHCANGHLFDEPNTYRTADGARTCRACGAAKARDRRAQKRVSNSHGKA